MAEAMQKQMVFMMPVVTGIAAFSFRRTCDVLGGFYDI